MPSKQQEAAILEGALMLEVPLETRHERGILEIVDRATHRSRESPWSMVTK